MLCARVVRGSISILKMVSPFSASSFICAAWNSGWYTPSNIFDDRAESSALAGSWIDKTISLLCSTSWREQTVAPASVYLPSAAKACSPAPRSMQTSTFHFFNAAMCSGSKETRVSAGGSFKTPILIKAIVSSKVTKKRLPDRGELPFF